MVTWLLSMLILKVWNDLYNLRGISFIKLSPLDSLIISSNVKEFFSMPAEVDLVTKLFFLSKNW
jgi:hypothetical protein